MPNASASPFANRLRKVATQRRRWAKRRNLTAYRLYDSDIPEYRYAVDWYEGHVQLTEYAARHSLGAEAKAAQLEEVVEACMAVLGLDRDHVHLKRREPKVWGREQYEKLGETGRRFTVREGDCRFWVNLDDYLDTGLFLDHRETRFRVGAEAKGKRFLNLFCYTGAFTVHAARGGARSTTSVDLSNTYLEWLRHNLELNELWDPRRHELLRSDVTRWLHQAKGQWDLAVLDPPSFSASKKMASTLDVQRDHVELIEATLSLLAPSGVLYFSTNYTGFSLDERALAGLSFEELTPRSIPEDFRNVRIHRCWRIVRPADRGIARSRRRLPPVGGRG